MPAYSKHSAISAAQTHPNQELQETSEQPVQEDVVYFDIKNYHKIPAEDKIFKLQIEQNEKFPKYTTDSQHLNIKTEYTNTDIIKSKFNNKTTISAQTTSKTKLLSDNFSFSTGTDLKEFLPIPDSTNYSMLSTSVGTKYRIKKFSLESEFRQDGNILTETLKNKISIGQTFNLTNSSAIKSSITKNLAEDNIFGEISFIYKPIKSKRNFSLEIDASSSSSQYNIHQQRLQFYGRIKI